MDLSLGVVVAPARVDGCVGTLTPDSPGCRSRPIPGWTGVKSQFPGESGVTAATYCKCEESVVSSRHGPT